MLDRALDAGLIAAAAALALVVLAGLWSGPAPADRLATLTPAPALGGAGSVPTAVPAIALPTLAPTMPPPVMTPETAAPAAYEPLEGLEAFTLPITSSIKVNGGFSRIHPGLDFSANLGTPVVAAEAGVAIFAGQSRWGYGNLIVLAHRGGWQSWYGHLHRIRIVQGDAVAQGQVIGLVGSTGKSTGAHLHFELRRGCSFYNPLTGEELADVHDNYRRDPYAALTCRLTAADEGR